MSTRLRRLFSISLNEISPSRIYSTNNQTRQWMIRVYRWISLCFCILYALSSISTGFFGLIKYTNQNLLLVLIYFFMVQAFRPGSTILPVLRTRPQSPPQYTDRWNKALYVVSVLAMTGSAIATFGYWAFLFPEEKDKSWIEILWFGFSPHGMSLILILVDFFFFTTIKIKWIHLIYPILYIIFYIGMALVYRACTGKWVYSFLDITRTSGKIAYPAIPVGAILLTLLYSFLSHIRSKCISRRHATFNASTAINEQQNDRFDDVTKLTEGSSVI